MEEGASWTPSEKPLPKIMGRHQGPTLLEASKRSHLGGTKKQSLDSVDERRLLASYSVGDIVYDTNPTDISLRGTVGRVCGSCVCDENGICAAVPVLFTSQPCMSQPCVKTQYLVPAVELSREPPCFPSGLVYGARVLYNAENKEDSDLEDAMDRGFLSHLGCDKSAWRLQKLTKPPGNPLVHGSIGTVTGYATRVDSISIAVMFPGRPSAVLLSPDELMTDEGRISDEENFDYLFK